MSFWTSETTILVALILAVAVAWRPAGRVVLGTLDARAAAIRAELEEAKRLREAAEAALAQYQLKQRDALAEAQEILARAKADAEAIGRQAAADLDAALKRREQQALESIAQSEAHALAEVRALAVDIAIEATRRLVEESLTIERGGALIDRATEELPSRLH